MQFCYAIKIIVMGRRQNFGSVANLIFLMPLLRLVVGEVSVIDELRLSTKNSRHDDRIEIRLGI